MNCGYPWIPDNGDGTYPNPVLHVDYSDPDVIRQGDDFWMVASSFNCAPGLPILHSKDLVNWSLVNHAIPRVPYPTYGEVRRGCGLWAPSIRYFSGKFWIFFAMPDEGIFVANTTDPVGQWSEPWCLQEAKGWIDPCPFWDEDGQAYLVHAYAMSRSGLKERIHLWPMTPDGRRLLGQGYELFHTPHHLYLEGPKVHKIDGWYHVLCPGGGVQSGWQVAFRSRSLPGPKWRKPISGQPKAIPATSDHFTGQQLGLQSQWHANPESGWLMFPTGQGILRLFPGKGMPEDISVYPRFLGQKFPARQFSVSVQLRPTNLRPGGVAGLAVTSEIGSHFVGLRAAKHGLEVVMGFEMQIEVLGAYNLATLDLEVKVGPDGSLRFSAKSAPVSLDRTFIAREGGWIGAKVGLFHLSEKSPDGFADFGPFIFSGPKERQPK